MATHHVKDKYFIYKAEKPAEAKFRVDLSKKIIDKFGKGPFHEQEIVRDIVKFSLDYYISKFKDICLNEKSIRFYQSVLWFHGQATELAYLYPHQDLSPDISSDYISSYRRKLKFILEMGCEVSMISGEQNNIETAKRIEVILDDLLFLGEMILMCVDLYAEQTMIEDVADVSFDENDLYVFSRRHHYEAIFNHIIDQLGSHLTKSVVDDNASDDFDAALKKCFGINYENVSHLIASIHEELKGKGGELVGFGWETLSSNLHRMFGVPLGIAEQFFQGLRLDKTNKMDLLDVACKPYKLNRYLYKPIIIWNIDGKDYALCGKSSWTEAIIQYTTNAIPWGKAPIEWVKNECFKAYVHSKEDDHDRWLDDEVEKNLQHAGVFYDRNVKQIQTENGVISIDIQGLGEIDFIIISPKMSKIYIVDCKHLLGRYDLVNQKNDYNTFSVGSKSIKPYNDTMRAKLKWLEENKHLLKEHFLLKHHIEYEIKDFSIDGIFIVNTPTFYMYNSEYRIYTVNQIEDVVLGLFKDPVFTIFIEDEEFMKMIKVEYPYFVKPTYLTFDPFVDDDE